MKKHLTKVLSFAVITMMVFTMTAALTACGEEVNIAPQPGGLTEFSTDGKKAAGNDGTRTSIDDARYFYWEPGDNIWIDDNGTYKPTTSSNIETTQPTARFFLNTDLTEAKYDVFYTGNSSSATSVTIAANQTQTEWNNTAHIGSSGDCGYAEARQQSGGGAYKFSLQHMASYVLIFPYKDVAWADDYTLMRIEITSENGEPIAGTYNFSKSGLASMPASNGTDKVTLYCGTSGFKLTSSQTNYVAAVLHPIEMNKLTIKYYMKNNTYNTTYTVEKKLSARTLRPGGVTTLKHTLLTYTFENTYYMWSAADWYWKGVSNYPTANTNYNDNYPKSNTDSRWYWTGSQAQNSCAQAPTYAAITWYLKGGVVWDTLNVWTIADNNGNLRTMKGGIWLKKKAKIPGFSSTAATTPHYTSAIVKSNQPVDAGENWFFLPAFGLFSNGILSSSSTNAGYWTSTRNSPSENPYYFGFHSAYAMVDPTSFGPELGFVAGTRPDGTPWFQ